MTLAESLTVVAAYGSLAVSAGALIPLAWQVRQATRANELGHIRDRKQATMEYLSGTMDRLTVLRDRGVPDHRDQRRVQEFIDRAVGGDGEAENLIVSYLTIYNMLGVACENDVFDLYLVDQTWGGTIIAVYENYSEWIQHRRERNGEGRLYEDLERLAGNMTRRQQNAVEGEVGPSSVDQGASTPSTSTIDTAGLGMDGPSKSAPEVLPGTVRT